MYLTFMNEMNELVKVILIKERNKVAFFRFVFFFTKIKRIE